MYRLIHAQAADDALIDIWADFWDRGEDGTAYRAALDRAYGRLTRAAASEGYHVREGLWRIDDPPVAIFFQIDDTTRVVLLTGYALLSPRTP